ncbi:MAG: hypothetical protein ABI323_03800 [Solirubrobacteraceae bacterium]
MKIAVAADELTGVAEAVLEQLRARGHELLPHGAYAPGERADWAWASDPGDTANVAHLTEIERGG